jgi:hypothetical protein
MIALLLLLAAAALLPGAARAGCISDGLIPLLPRLGVPAKYGVQGRLEAELAELSPRLPQAYADLIARTQPGSARFKELLLVLKKEEARVLGDRLLIGGEHLEHIKKIGDQVFRKYSSEQSYGKYYVERLRRLVGLLEPALWGELAREQLRIIPGVDDRLVGKVATALESMNLGIAELDDLQRASLPWIAKVLENPVTFSEGQLRAIHKMSQDATVSTEQAVAALREAGLEGYDARQVASWILSKDENQARQICCKGDCELCPLQYPVRNSDP